MIVIPVSIIATVHVREGKMEEAKKVLKKIVPKIKESEPNTLEYIPFSIKGEPNTIMFFERYKDEAAMKTHTVNLGKNMAEFGPLLVPERPAIKNLEEIL